MTDLQALILLVLTFGSTVMVLTVGLVRANPDRRRGPRGPEPGRLSPGHAGHRPWAGSGPDLVAGDFNRCSYLGGIPPVDRGLTVWGRA
jgi:hypothetical protein